MDKFPEAYSRFKEKVDTKDIKSFQELLASFNNWAGNKYQGTRKQKRALAIEGKEDLKIGMTEERRMIYTEKEISYIRNGKEIRYTRKARIVLQVVDVVTGKFYSPPKEEDKNK